MARPARTARTNRIHDRGRGLRCERACFPCRRRCRDGRSSRSCGSRPAARPRRLTRPHPPRLTRPHPRRLRRPRPPRQNRHRSLALHRRPETWRLARSRLATARLSTLRPACRASTASRRRARSAHAPRRLPKGRSPMPCRGSAGAARRQPGNCTNAASIAPCDGLADPRKTLLRSARRAARRPGSRDWMRDERPLDSPPRAAISAGHACRNCGYPMLSSPPIPHRGAPSSGEDVTTRNPRSPRTYALMAVVSSVLRLPSAAAAGVSAARPLPALFLTWLRAVVAAALIVAAPLARAQDADTVTLNFVNADIDAVVKAVGEITGRNFLVDPRVKGTVNIVSARPVPKALVYPTLLSALRMQGFAAIESDGITKIVPEAEAKTQAGPVARAAVSASGDRIVTQVIPLRYESAAQLVTVLRPLVTPNNVISAYIPNNAVIVTDYADNVKRIDRIIASLDQPPSGEPVLVQVKNASAIDVAALVNRVLSENAPGAPAGQLEAQQRVALVPDPRSNSILVRADNPARAARVRQLIEQLDTPSRMGGNVFIVYLKNAEAAQVAETLRGLYGGERSPTTAVTTAGLPTASGAAATMTTTLGTSPAATSPLATSATGGPQTAFAAGGAMVQADTANNALIIMAP